MRIGRFVLYLTAVIAWGAPVQGVVVPAGTALMVRLTSRVDSTNAKLKDPVDAVLLTPVLLDGRVVIPARTLVHGHVSAVQSAAKATDGRASLGLEFGSLQNANRLWRFEARLTGVDNARESVDAQTGKITGINAAETLTSRMDKGIQKIAERYAELAGVLESVKGSVLHPADPEITYEPGVELTLALTRPLTYDGPAGAPPLIPIQDERAIVQAVNDQPWQTFTARTPRPSDITSIMFIGSAQSVDRAFREAGWVAPEALSSNSKLETFKAVAESRGYKEGPFSLLLLDGAEPTFTFQKANNTFAQRHHVRIFQRPGTWNGKPIWVCSATHDIAIDFSQHDRTFIHKIDPNIDRERAKVVSDMLFTGRVKSLELVARPSVPQEGLSNATGDPLQTDGRMAVVILE